MRTLRPREVDAAIKAAGGGAALADKLNLRRQAIYQWTRVPAHHVLDLERLSGVPRHLLRPDLYPAPGRDPLPSQRKRRVAA